MKQAIALPSLTKMVKALWPYYWSHPQALKSRVIISLFFLFLSMAINVYIPLLLRDIINILSKNIFGQITAVLLAYGFLWTIGQAIISLREMIMFKSIQRSIRLFCTDFLKRLHELSFQFHTHQPLGELTNSLERAQQALPNFIWGLAFLIIPTLIEVTCAIVIIWQLYNWIYSLILFLTLTIFTVFSIFSMKRSLAAESRSNVKELEASTILMDSLINQATVKYFNNQDYEIHKCDQAFGKREIYTTKTLLILEGIKLTQGVILGIGLTILLLLAGKEVILGHLQISDFVLLNGYVLQFAYPLTLFGFVLKEAQQSFIDLSNIIKIMDMPLKNNERKKRENINLSFKNISFEKVSFGYLPTKVTLKAVSFTIPAGKFIAVVGTTGAGKSTLSALLLNLYSLTKGKITVDGINIDDLSKTTLKRLIGIVPQDISLFHTSILQNVHYARLEASIEEVHEALEMACLDITAFPDGIHTLVGERGAKLSQGEKQRIALARLFLQRPSLCILDEHTSSLDPQTEQNVQRNINKFFKDATFLVIAHRLQTIMHAHQIIVLEEGRIIETGTHEYLINEGSVYASLWREQQSISSLSFTAALQNKYQEVNCA